MNIPVRRRPAGPADTLAGLRRAMLATSPGTPARAAARERLILAMVPLACHIARRIGRTRPHIGHDVRSACLLAAVEVADNWNPCRSSAGYWIGRTVDRAITHLIAMDCPVSFGVALKRRRIPRWSEAARSAYDRGRIPAESLNAEDCDPAAITDDSRAVSAVDAAIDVARHLAPLVSRSPRQHDIVTARLGIDRPIESNREIAGRLGVRVGLVGDLLATALASLGCEGTGRRVVAGMAGRPRKAAA